MRTFLPYIIVGLVSGSLYGLAGVGLVLTYRTSGVFNFAHGAVAAAGAYLYYQLSVLWGLPWPVAALLTVVVFGGIIGLLLQRLAAMFTSARLDAIIVSTIGLLLLIQGALFVRYGSAPIPLRDALPQSGFFLGQVQVRWSQVITICVTLACTAALSVFLQVTRLGTATRAVVDDPQLLDLTGTNPRHVQTVAWTLGSMFAVLTGIMIAPTLGLDAFLLSLLVVQAYGAVAFGAFRSLPLTYAGGLLVGVLASIATKFWGAQPPLNGIPNSVPFLILIFILLVLPTRLLPGAHGRTGGAVTGRTTIRLRGKAKVVAYVGAAAVLIAVPFVVGNRLPVYIRAVSFVVVFLSLGLLVRVSGQISLCHAAFAALGVTTFSHLTDGAGLPWPAALVLAGLVTVPFGALLAIPAIRLSGIYLALATFGFGIFMQQVVFSTGFMFGKAIHVQAPRPQFGFLDGADDRVFYFEAVAIALVCSVAVSVVVRSRLGRLFRAMSDSPVTLISNGLGLNMTRVLVFCISAFFAGIGGALSVVQAGRLSLDSGFGPFNSLMWLAVLALASIGGLEVSAWMAAATLIVVPAYLGSLTVEWQTLLFGISAVVAAAVASISFRPGRWLAEFAERSQLRREAPITRARDHSLPRDLRAALPHQSRAAEMAARAELRRERRIVTERCTFAPTTTALGSSERARP